MKPRELIDALNVGRTLKDTTRHCYTAKNRHESVAEHSWMMTLMAFFLKDEFPDVDMNKVIEMCIIHDLGECFTGDIPTFLKTSENEKTEKELLLNWVNSLPKNTADKMNSLYKEMEERKTSEARVYKAIDSLDAVLRHNISPISTWEENEYELNKTYGNDKVEFSEYLTALRKEMLKDTIEKIENEK